MSENLGSQNHNYSDEKEYLHSKAQKIIDGYARFFCPNEQKEDYESYKNESPEKRLATFNRLVRETHRKTLDLIAAPIDSPEALKGNCIAQEKLNEALISSGEYINISELQRDENDRNVDILPILDGENRLSKNHYLFSRNRVILKCDKSDEKSHYVIKRSYFIADEDFMDLLDVDPHFPYLSNEKTELCEEFLDSDDSYVQPHSVLYFIKSEKPDNLKPKYTKSTIKSTLDYVHGRKHGSMNHETQEKSRKKPKTSSDGTLHIDQHD